MIQLILNDFVDWYQQKIIVYDKQQWERYIENNYCYHDEYYGVPTKAARLKTELIDVDLFGGSSNPKAKPKHGLITATYLALGRLLLMPFYYKWWIQQINFLAYLFFLFLYVLQVTNIYIYYNYFPKESESDIVTSSEVLVPAVMMLLLCIVHSQIVSTRPAPRDLSKKYSKQKLQHHHSRPSRSRVRLNIQETGISKTFEDSAVFENRKNKKIKDDLSVLANGNQKNGEEVVSVPNLSVSEQKRSPKIIKSHNAVQNCILDKESNETEGKKRHEQIVISESENDFKRCHIKSKETENAIEENLLKNLNEYFDDDWNETDGEKNFHEEFHFCKDDLSLNNEYKSTTIPRLKISKKECDSEEEGECEDPVTNNHNETTTSATEWIGVTSNSDECSYSSEPSESYYPSDDDINDHPLSSDFINPPYPIFPNSPFCNPSDRVSCTIWTHREVKKIQLSGLEISSVITAKVAKVPESMDCLYAGLCLGLFLSFLPSLKRISDQFGIDPINSTFDSVLSTETLIIKTETYSDIICKIIDLSLGSTILERTVILISAFERLVLTTLLFVLLAVAERTYEKRLLYAKLFSHLTSSRRAKKFDLPHFRLNKVRNIKTWLSIRSYLKRIGPQRSVEIIVSSTFIITLALLSFVTLELIKDLNNLYSQYNIEALFWSFCLGIFILRFMTFGTKTNKNYRNLSALITEQINLYLQIEQKPHKKEELMVANSVLKLAADLIKEIESPFKISGLSANPYLYTITKVVLLSALSGILSELLGFKLKLHKIKIK